MNHLLQRCKQLFVFIVNIDLGWCIDTHSLKISLTDAKSLSILKYYRIILGKQRSDYRNPFLEGICGQQIQLLFECCINKRGNHIA